MKDDPYVDVYDSKLFAFTDDYVFSIRFGDGPLRGTARIRDSTRRVVATGRREDGVEQLLFELRQIVDHQELCKAVLKKMAGTRSALGGRVDHGYELKWSGEYLRLQIDPDSGEWVAQFGEGEFEASKPEIAVAGARARHSAANDDQYDDASDYGDSASS